MVNIPELVVDRERFVALAEECQKVIDTRKRLPDFVFRRPFANYFAVEHAYILRRGLGLFLSNIANLGNDVLVNYMTIAPDAVDYYYRHKSFFGLASFVPANLAERYLSVMSNEGSPDSFCARGGDVGAFWGSSLKWGISCDRISWEIAVIAVPENIDVPGMSGFRCMNASQLSSYMNSQYPTRGSVAADFTRTFLANYAI